MLRVVIKQARIKKGLTIRQLALYSQVPRSCLSRFESGKADLPTVKLVRVLQQLGFEIKLSGFNLLDSGELAEYLQTVQLSKE
jgi:transcriptional regulator with XRE-family HTH domain